MGKGGAYALRDDYIGAPDTESDYSFYKFAGESIVILCGIDQGKQGLVEEEVAKYQETEAEEEVRE